MPSEDAKGYPPTMPLMRALLLYIAAAGVTAGAATEEEALPAGGLGAAAYQLVIPARSAPATHFASAPPPPFQGTLFSPLPHASPAIHRFIPAAALLRSPGATTQHPHSFTFYSHIKGLDDLAQGATYATGFQSQAASHPRHFQNSLNSQAVPSVVDLADSKFYSHRQAPRQYKTAEYETNIYQGTRQQVPGISDRQFQDQQPFRDFQMRQFPQFQILKNQQYLSPRIDDTSTAASHIPENYRSYGFSSAAPHGRQSLLLPASRSSEGEATKQTPSLLANALAVPLPLPHDIQLVAPAATAPHAPTPLYSVQPQQEHYQSYRVDVDGKGFGYGYAMQRSYNPEIIAPSLHGN